MLSPPARLHQGYGKRKKHGTSWAQRVQSLPMIPEPKEFSHFPRIPEPKEFSHFPRIPEPKEFSHFPRIPEPKEFSHFPRIPEPEEFRHFPRIPEPEEFRHFPRIPEPEEFRHFPRIPEPEEFRHFRGIAKSWTTSPTNDWEERWFVHSASTGHEKTTWLRPNQPNVSALHLTAHRLTVVCVVLLLDKGDYPENSNILYFVLITSILLKLSCSGSLFRMLAVIPVSDFSFVFHWTCLALSCLWRSGWGWGAGGGDGGGGVGWGVCVCVCVGGGGGVLYLILHCHHQNGHSRNSNRTHRKCRTLSNVSNAINATTNLK